MKIFDPVFDAQSTFRRLLEATYRPGVLFSLPSTEESAEEAMLLTLLDHEVSFAATGVAPEISERLKDVTGARLGTPEEVDFVLFGGGDSRGEILEMKRGTLEEPAGGATAIYSVQRLSTRGSVTLSLSGPGVDGVRTLGVEGLIASEVEAVQESRSDYPKGVDIFLVDKAGLVTGLPRSTRLETKA